LNLTLLNIIIARTAAFLAACAYLQANYNAYEISVTLPVPPGDKTSGLNDLIKHHPYIMERVRMVFGDNFGAWVCDRRADRGASKKYFHRHLVIFTKHKVDTKYAAELINAYLTPIGLCRANDGNPAVEIKAVRSLRGWLNYMAKHKPCEKTIERFGPFHAAKKWGNWPENVPEISLLESIAFNEIGMWLIRQRIQHQRSTGNFLQGCRPPLFPPLLAFLIVVLYFVDINHEKENKNILCLRGHATERSEGTPKGSHAGVGG